MYALAAMLAALDVAFVWLLPPAMAKQRPKAKKTTIKIPGRSKTLPAAVDDKVDKLLALPLSATDLQPAEVEILDGTPQDKSLQAQGSQHDMIDLANGAENSCEEQDFGDMYDILYEPHGPGVEVEEYWQLDRSLGK